MGGQYSLTKIFLSFFSVQAFDENLVVYVSKTTPYLGSFVHIYNVNISDTSEGMFSHILGSISRSWYNQTEMFKFCAHFPPDISVNLRRKKITLENEFRAFICNIFSSVLYSVYKISKCSLCETHDRFNTVLLLTFPFIKCTF